MDLPEAKLLTISQAGKILGISPKTLKRWEKAGKIRIPRTPTGNRFFTKESIEAFKSSLLSGTFQKTQNTQIVSSLDNQNIRASESPILRKSGSPSFPSIPNWRLPALMAILIISILANFFLFSKTDYFHPVRSLISNGTNQAARLASDSARQVLGVKDFIVPALEESAPLGNLISKVQGLFKGGSFVIPLLGQGELAVSDDLKVSGKGYIAKDLELGGNLKIKGDAVVGRLVTGIVDPYLIENNGDVQSFLEIRTLPSSLGSADIVFEPGGIEKLRIKEDGNVNISGDLTGRNLTITNNEAIGGNLTLAGTLNGNTLSSTKLTFSGNSPSIYPTTTNTGISLNGNGSGAINIGNSGTGDVYIAGGSGDSGCTITNSNGNINCAGTITASADLDVRGGDITTNQTTFNLLNTTATTLNIGGASTTISIGASTGTTTVNNALTITGATTLSSTLSVTGTSTFTGNLTVNGRPTFTKAPTSAHTGTFTIDSSTWNQSDAAIYINPASATADSNLLGVAVGGNVKFDVDAEGDIFARNLVLTGNTTTGTTTVSGDLTVEGNTTLGDATTDTLTINPATITLAGGNKTIDITGAATRTLTLLNSTVSQVADLDLSDGSLLTGGTSRLTNAGVLQNITGLTVSSGTVSLPNDQIDPSEITQGTAGQLLLSNTTPDTTWTTLSGDATLAGTGAITLASTGVTANTYGSTTAVPVITVDAKGRLTTVTTASISSAWSSLTDPTTNLSLAHAANTTTFTWNAATGASTNLFNLTDTASNTGTGYLLNIATASLSNALPLRIAARGNTIIDTTATGGVTIGNATSAQAVTVDAGTATLNLGNSNNAKTINIGTGTAADTINIGSGGTTADTITIGGLSGTTINITGTVNITGAIVGTSTIQGTRLISTVATGTAPLTVTSTTVVTNLNADLLDGMDSTAFGDATAANQTTILNRIGTNTDAAGTSTLFARLARIDDTDLGATADAASTTGTIFARLTSLINNVGSDSDPSSSTGSVHAKLKDLKTSVGSTSDAASSTGSTNAKLAQLLNGTTQVPVVRPDLAAPVTLTASTSVWVYGAWSQIVAANDLAAHNLIGIVLSGGGSLSQDFQIQVGTGAAGSEVVVGTWAFNTQSNAGYMLPIPVVPMIQIPANARVAARLADGGSATMPIKLIFIPRPL